MIRKILKYLKITRDPVKRAIKGGMIVGKEFSCMGNPNFGSEPYLITFEDYVRVSSNVTFVTHDGGTHAFRDIPKYVEVIKFGKIHVGERTFIGCNSIIMPGVSIGKRCVIAAGSIVTHDVPDGTVVGGAPARIIMTTLEYAEKSLKNMPPYDKQSYNEHKKSYLIEYLK